MTAHTEPLVEHDDTDYAFMPDCISADGFTPSLPTLINRPLDTDAQSVSDVESISNGETVSDADEYDEITHSEIPALAHAAGAHAARGYSQEDEPSDEDMERIMMSDRTIIPATPTLAQCMPHLSSKPANPTTTLDDAHVCGLYMADQPYQLPDRPLRLMLVAESSTSHTVISSIISKVVVSITGNPSDKTAILDAASRAEKDHDVLDSLDALFIPVEVSHVVEYHPLDRVKTVKLKGGETTTVQDLIPDLAILYRGSHEDFPLLTAFAMALSHHKVPMLEIAEKVLASPSNEGPGPCTITHTAQGDYSVRLSLASSEDMGHDSTSSMEFPLTLQAFEGLEDGDLSRHLEYIGNYAASLVLDSDKQASTAEAKTKTLDVWSLIDSRLTKYILRSILGLLSISLAVTLLVNFLAQQVSPMSDLAARTPVLQAALNNSGLSAINASDVLRYPTTTTVIGTLTTSGVAFPTAATVHVVKADQLLVSLPSPYWKSVQIGVFKNGKPLSNVNNTSLINGVVSLSLPSSDAHGQIQVSILHDNKSHHNETVKVDLGNRLLQRVTYEKAAKGVQQDVSDYQHAAKVVQAKVVSDVQALFNQSVCGARSLGNNMLDGLKSTGNAIGTASNRTSSGFAYMGELTYNSSSSIGAFVKSAIPRKHHLIRAQNNVRKIRTRVLGSKLVTKQDVVTSKPGALHQAFSSLKAKAGKLQGYLRPGLRATKKPVHHRLAVKESTKILLASSKVKTGVKSGAIATKKSKQELPPVSDKRKNVKGSERNGKNKANMA